jgi:hypothetical protein
VPQLHDRRFNSYFAHNNDGTIHEYNAARCAHGGEIIVIKPGSTNWDLCMKCEKPICLHCARVMHALHGECVEYERQIRAMETVVRMPDLDAYRKQAMLIDSRELRSGSPITRDQVLMMMHTRDSRLPKVPLLEMLRARTGV